MKTEIPEKAKLVISEINTNQIIKTEIELLDNKLLRASNFAKRQSSWP